MSLDNRLQAYSCKGSMDSKAVIAFLEDFVGQLKQPTVIVLDNAPIHRSKQFLAKAQEWGRLGHYLFFLPKYSPHLNLIEILWRKIKYQWLEYEKLKDQLQLDAQLENILSQFGTKYTINFKNGKVSNVFG